MGIRRWASKSWGSQLQAPYLLLYWVARRHVRSSCGAGKLMQAFEAVIGRCTSPHEMRAPSYSAVGSSIRPTRHNRRISRPSSNTILCAMLMRPVKVCASCKGFQGRLSAVVPRDAYLGYDRADTSRKTSDPRGRRLGWLVPNTTSGYLIQELVDMFMHID